MKKRLIIKIKGWVSGRGLALLAMKNAYSLGVNGYVSYLSPDLAIIEVEGTQIQLEDYLSWCRKELSDSGETTIETESTQPKYYKEFEIKQITQK